MTPYTFLWWFIPLRTAFGLITVVIALLMLRRYSADRHQMRRRGVNGIVEAIITGEIRDASILVMILVWLTLLSIVGWVRIYRPPPVTMRDVVGALLLGMVLTHIGTLKILRWRSYFKIVELAEQTELAAKATQNHREQQSALHTSERMDDRIDRMEVARTLKGHIDQGIKAADSAYHEANSVNIKIAELMKDMKALGQQHLRLQADVRTALRQRPKKR